MNSQPPGWRPPPWCWPPPCAAWATFPAGCVAGFCPGSPEILKKVHLMINYNFLCSVTWRSSFEYLATTTTNKQTCCHLWYSSSCPSIVVSLTLTDAVEWECQLSFELFINLACCTSFTSQGVNFGAEYPLSSCDSWENLAQLSDALCCNHQKIKRTFFACFHLLKLSLVLL